jgi:predicted component of type VI protein secretion system
LNNKRPDKNTNIEIKRGDEISIGKHVVSYRWENAASDKLPSTMNEAIPRNVQNGWLQVLSGPKMGRTMQLNKTRFRIGSSDTHGAMITSRDDGYYLASLDNTRSVKVDNHNIGDTSVNLQDGNTIQVGDMEMLFFIQE